MKCIILAAGYATRLYPLTLNFPKPLLKVKDKPILEWLLDDIGACGAIDQYIIISNHRYVGEFESWAGEYRASAPVTVLDDGTESNETRLGAVRDISFAVDSLKLDDDLIIMAGDNVLDFSLTRLIDYFKQRRTSCVMRFYQSDLNKLRKTGVAQVDDDGHIISMEEKPAEPKSHWCVPPFYCITRGDVPLIDKAIADGCGTDAPGSFIAWLSAHAPVHAMEMPGRRYDIGDTKSYEQVQAEYEGIRD